MIQFGLGQWKFYKGSAWNEKSRKSFSASGPGVRKVNRVKTVLISIPEYCFVIYHDGEYKESDIDVEFCEAVTSFGKDTDTIKFKKLEKVPAAACVYHKGPYSTISNAYSHLFKWIADNGYAPCDNPRESYIDGVWNKESDSQWLTELQVPIIKKLP